jgi:Fe-S cluster assembly protein SufD
MSAVLAERITQEHAAAAASLPAGVLPAERRAQALASLAAAGMPTVREENWKYANLRALEKVRFTPRAGAVAYEVAATNLPPALASYSRYVFVDGVFAPALSCDAGHSGVSLRTFRGPKTAADAGVRVGAATNEAVGTVRGAVGLDTRLAWLNEAFATDAALIQVAAGTDCPACLEVIFVATDDGDKAASYPRLELHVGSDARMGLIERHVSVGSDANFVNAAINVRLDRGASVDHYRIQQAGARAVWFDTLTASVYRAGR